MLKSTVYGLRKPAEFLDLDWKEDELVRCVQQNSKVNKLEGLKYR